MSGTHFQDFKRDNGYPITVEYSFSPGSETTYSPMYGAVSGDPCEVGIVAAWPNTPRFDRLYGLRNRLAWIASPWWMRPSRFIARWAVEAVIWLWGMRARLSDTERERMEAWIAEHRVDEICDESDYL